MDGFPAPVRSDGGVVLGSGRRAFRGLITLHPTGSCLLLGGGAGVGCRAVSPASWVTEGSGAPSGWDTQLGWAHLSAWTCRSIPAPTRPGPGSRILVTWVSPQRP